MQVSVYVDVFVMLLTNLDPLVASEPDQAPVAAQVDALLEDQVSVELPPLLTVLELAFSETAGAELVTVTVADCAAEPPGPVQVITYFVVALSATVSWVPLAASVPVQPPDAEQAAALVEDQVSLDAAPLWTVLGLALKLIEGGVAVTATAADCDELPPAPVHVSV